MDVPETAGAPETPAQIHTAVPPRRTGLTVAAGVLAGLLAWFAGEAVLRTYQGSLHAGVRMRPTPEDVLAQANAVRNSAAVSFAALGGLLGAALGAAGGLGRRPIRSTILGLVLGAVVGGAVTALLVPIYFRWQNADPDDLIAPLMTHAAIWSAVGATAGLAFGTGLGAGRWKNGAVGGLAGAALAAVIYEIAGAAAFPSARTDRPVSETAATRAMAHLLVAALAAAGAALAVRKAAPVITEPAPAPPA